jgi:hypothetical protein
MKKRDATAMDDYMGIFKMGVVIILFMTVVTRRLHDVCQTNKIVRRWQGGFMPGEECPLRVASIFDFAGRRHSLGLPMHAGAIDIPKAYDTIPH